MGRIGNILYYQDNCGDNCTNEEVHHFLLAAVLSVCRQIAVLQSCVSSDCVDCTVDLACV